jgi:chromosome segregation ATPase
MENQLLNRDQYELQLKQQIGELQSQNDALELKFQTLRESAIFYDARLTSLAEEKKAHPELAEDYRSQLEDALLRIYQLQKELADSCENVQAMKDCLRLRQDDQDQADWIPNPWNRSLQSRFHWSKMRSKLSYDRFS